MHPQGNILSAVAILIWIPVAFWVAGRSPPAKAAALLFLIPVMFLPEAVVFRLPGLPELGKERIGILCVLIAVLLFHRQQLGRMRLGKWVKLATLTLLCAGVVTVLLNTDPISDHAAQVPPHRPSDVVHIVVIYMLGCVLPFALAVATFSSPGDLRVFFRFLLVAALVYSVLQLIELRFSPQLHRWVYGYHQHTFAHAKRGDGFRPNVFMQNGLAVAIFTVAGVLAAAALHKVRAKIFGIGAEWALAYLSVILLLSKSLAAFLYAVMAVPLILFASPKRQVQVAALLAIIVLAYPEARSAGLVPVQDILGLVDQYREDKVGSMMVRFENEDMLLERAKERPFFGWGSFHCRRCIRHPRTGDVISVSDGDWIKAWGAFGLVGFLAKYLLLLFPIFLLSRRLKYVRRLADRRLLSALALIIGFSALDLLPNGNFNYLVFVYSGVLMGCTDGILRHQARHPALKRARKDARSVRAPITYDIFRRFEKGAKVQSIDDKTKERTRPHE